MEYVITIALKHSGDAAEADRLLDGFVATHPQNSPVVGEEGGLIDVTFAVEADDAHRAAEVGWDIAEAGLAAAAVTRPVLSFHVERTLEPIPA